MIDFCNALETVCIDTVESGKMTKDLAVCIHGNKVNHGEHYLYTEEFLNELDSALNDQAHKLYDENITPIVKENNIPDGIHDPIKKKAINELVGVLRTQVQKHKDKIPGVK